MYKSQQTDPFMDVVERELKGKASEAEKAWLRSEENLLRWEDALALLLTQTQGNLARLNQKELEEKQLYLAQGASGKTAWFARKTELGKKKNAAKFFVNIVSTKRFEVKQLRAKIKAKSTLPVASDMELYFPSATRELIRLLQSSRKPEQDADAFLAAFVVRTIKAYEPYGPNEEEILDRLIDQEDVMGFWAPEEE